MTAELDKPVIVADTTCKTGEGPMWHDGEKKVYWVDIPNGVIHRYDPATETHEAFYRGTEMIGGYTFQTDGSILLFQDRGAIRLLNDGKVTDVISEIPEERDGRFNDVIADPEGRVFCGTMPIGDRPGRLYHLDRDLTLTVVIEDAGLSNGMGFTPDLEYLYHSDSSDNRLITKLKYDRATGDLSDRQFFFHPGDNEGLPDGMTVDAEGYVWSAQWDGSALIRIAPDGNEIHRIAFPAKKVSSIIFGGKDYGDAYVTTANVNGREVEGPGAGALFRVNLGVKGRPEFLSKIGL
jgi:D-xylono/L-arabinono-1,4-lactonase